MFHATSSTGTHLQLKLPGNDGAFHWLTGSGSVDISSQAISNLSNRWSHWVFQVDHITGKSKVFRDGVLTLSNEGVSRPFGADVNDFVSDQIILGKSSGLGKLMKSRISENLESPERISASFENQRPDGTSYISYGQVAGPPSSLLNSGLRVSPIKTFPILSKLSQAILHTQQLVYQLAFLLMPALARLVGFH